MARGDWVGDGVVRLTIAEGIDAAALRRALAATPGVHDVVVTEQHASAYFDGDPPDLDDGVARFAHPSTGTTPGTLHRVRVRYDGADLPAIAEATGLDVETVIALHGGRTYTVRVVGFVPGFAYLGDVDPRLVCARRGVPRTAVPAGSVALAGDRTGIYPSATPGGWHLLGTAVDLRPFDPAHGALFALGDRVCFEQVS